MLTQPAERAQDRQASQAPQAAAHNVPHRLPLDIVRASVEVRIALRMDRCQRYVRMELACGLHVPPRATGAKRTQH